MPMYEIEQYELWTSKVRVTAPNRGAAIAAVYAGRGVPVDDSCELIEVEMGHGMPQEGNEDLVAELQAAGVELRDDAIIESIREIECLDDEDDEKPFKIYMVFGEKTTVAELALATSLEGPISEYSFATQAELQAFMEGIDAMDGYLESTTFDSMQEALDYVKEIVGEEEIVLGADEEEETEEP